MKSNEDIRYSPSENYKKKSSHCLFRSNSYYIFAILMSKVSFIGIREQTSAHTLHNSRILMHAFAARFFTRQRVVGIHGCRLC